MVSQHDIDVLAWYAAMGVSDAVSDHTTNWLERAESGPGTAWRAARLASDVAHKEPASSVPMGRAAAAAPPSPDRARSAQPAATAQTPGPAQGQSRQFPTALPDVALMAAREAARRAGTLADLARMLAEFDGCGLKATAKNLCFYRGAPMSRLMLIGEAPGRDEDIEGRPFVGRAGQLLDRMLAAIGIGESDAHITNIVYWRPPGNRTPTPQEAEVCRPFLERQIELVKPEIILLLGGAAAKHVLNVTDGILRIRGKWRDIEVGALEARAIATLHPAYLLRTPIAKRQAWRDLLAVKAALANGN